MEERRGEEKEEEGETYVTSKIVPFKAKQIPRPCLPSYLQKRSIKRKKEGKKKKKGEVRDLERVSIVMSCGGTLLIEMV